MVVRDAHADDHPAVHALNDASTPHVNALNAGQFAWLSANADYFRVAIHAGALAGFVMALRSGTPYWSANYGWFSERYDDFIYLDRVVVAPEFHRQGIGAALYADLVRYAAARWRRIVLEVNVEPPNPGSMAFHARMGFRRVGERRYEGGEVAMFERLLRR